MKMLVFSDSHGVTSLMEEALDAHIRHGGVDLLVHLGDGTRDFEIVTKYKSIPTVSVAGNHEEFTSSYLDRGSLLFERRFELGGLTFLAMHGHKWNVKSGIQSAVDRAIAVGADVLLYGHTHERMDLTLDGSNGGSVRVINPGAAGKWYNASFALLHIEDGKIVCGFGGRQ